MTNRSIRFIRRCLTTHGMPSPKAYRHRRTHSHLSFTWAQEFQYGGSSVAPLELFTWVPVINGRQFSYPYKLISSCYLY